MSYCYKLQNRNHLEQDCGNFRYDFPKNMGFMNIEKNLINENITLFKTEILANDNLAIEEGLENHQDCIYINFSLNGNLKWTSKSQSIEVFYGNFQTTIYFVKEIDGIINIKKDEDFQSLGILLNANFIKQNLPDFECFNETKIIKNIPSDIHSSIIAKEIFAHKNNEKFSNIFLQSKALELVYKELLGLYCPKAKSMKLSDYDINALYKARQILLSNYEFIGIKNLSKMVCLNEFKLKFGFKKLFNQTPYQISLQNRLNIAKKLLLQKEYSIKEISKTIGFKYQQNFTKSFSKHFGILPKDV